MADMQEQLNAILGDPEAMAQITRLAQSLSGGLPSPGDGGDASSTPAEDRSKTSSPDLASLLGGLDPRLVQTALRLYGEYTAGDDRKTALLAALKPLLKEERRETIEKAERCARLAHVIRSAMTLFREEGESHV